MIEIHTHILPDLDDGAVDWAEAWSLVRAYVEQGVTDILCTSHLLAPQMLDLLKQNAYLEHYLHQLTELRQWAAAHDLPVRLHPGHELLLIPDLLRCLRHLGEKSRTALTLAGSAYLLVELPHWLSGGISSLERLLFGLQMDGFEPILAHPERIVDFDEVLPMLQQWVVQDRVYLQINASAVVPPTDNVRQARYRRRRSRVDRLIQLGLVHFAASDAHDSILRPPQQQDLFRILAESYGDQVARLLLIDNPTAVLQDQPICSLVPDAANT